MAGVVPPPYGIPPGPSLPPEDLLRAYVEGAGSGVASDGGFHIEGDVLMARGLVPLAIRLPEGVFLVRDDIPPDVEPLRDRLGHALTGAGIRFVEADPALSQVVGIERTGQRGAVWDLWGPGSEEAHGVLTERAAGELAGRIDDRAAREAATIERTLAEMEREFED